MTVKTETMRESFARAMNEALHRDPRTGLVLAAISRDLFPRALREFPDRVVDVGIREQAMVGVGAGMALAGLRTVIHTYAPFLVERPFEQVKLDLGHQDAGAVLVSVGASYDNPAMGRTHQAPGDVALLDTLPGWAVHVPGHPAEVPPLLAAALESDGRVYLRLSERSNRDPMPVGPGLVPVRHGSLGVVVAVGPTLDAVLAATEGVDVSVLYAGTVRPFDRAGLRAAVSSSAPVVLTVEPYLRGTSAAEVAEALADVPHRQASAGVRRDAEVRAYGSAEDHDGVHGLDAEGVHRALTELLR